jgi:anti-anti-sigma factor
MVNGVPVVAAPTEIDVSNADWFQAVLRQAHDGGHATFVVDMSHTQFCASSGVGVLARAHKRAWPKVASCGWSSPPVPPCCASWRSPASTA